MMLDERQDWIEHLLFNADVTARKLRLWIRRPWRVHQREQVRQRRILCLTAGELYAPAVTSNCFDVPEVYSVEDNSTDLTD